MWIVVVTLGDRLKALEGLVATLLWALAGSTSEPSADGVCRQLSTERQAERRWRPADHLEWTVDDA